MTVKKATRCGGYAAVVARQKLHSSQQLDILTIKPGHTNFNITVGFNEKDQLQLTNKDDDEHKKENHKQENIPIDDITNCVNIENYPNCENTLVFYVTKNLNKEAIALKFENEQDFKRIYFTYKYFKMRNRLTNNVNNLNSLNYTDSVFAKNNYNSKNRNSIDDFSIYDKKDYENDDGLTLVQPKSRFDQPMSLIGIRNELTNGGEIDSIIHKDVEIPSKPDRKRLFHKKPKAPPPPVPKDTKVLKGEFVRVNVDRIPDLVPKDSKVNKVPDILMFRDTKAKKNSPTSNLWTASNKVTTGYESDREEWRRSRSQFSTTAFDSLARPTKAAMALTLRQPPRVEPLYYRLSDTPKLTPLPFRPNNFLPRPPRLPRPNPDLKRNLNPEIKRNLNPDIKRNLNLTDHRKFTSLQNLDIPKKLSEKKALEMKKTNQSNLSTKITGLTNKLRDLGNSGNTLGRFKAQSHGDVANLKPVLKDGKRSVMRTCSAEPPKKVTFSAFATVQVV